MESQVETTPEGNSLANPFPLDHPQPPKPTGPRPAQVHLQTSAFKPLRMKDMKDLKDHPISNIEWIDVNNLNSNDYNPNCVAKPEMKLLELSLLKQGWVQPIICTKDLTIIDGYHRTWLTKNSQAVRDMTGGLVPVSRLDLSEPERMFLTIRMNRAKGNHVAFKMHEVITQLYQTYGVPKEEIAKNIGANLDEVELLLQENVFQAMDIKNHKYSKAWVPK